MRCSVGADSANGYKARARAARCLRERKRLAALQSFRREPSRRLLSNGTRGIGIRRTAHICFRSSRNSRHEKVANVGDRPSRSPQCPLSVMPHRASTSLGSRAETLYYVPAPCGESLLIGVRCGRRRRHGSGWSVDQESAGLLVGLTPTPGAYAVTVEPPPGVLKEGRWQGQPPQTASTCEPLAQDWLRGAHLTMGDQESGENA